MTQNELYMWLKGYVKYWAYRYRRSVPPEDMVQEIWLRIMQQHADGYYKVPHNSYWIVTRIARAVAISRQRRDREEYTDQIDMVGEDTELEEHVAIRERLESMREEYDRDPRRIGSYRCSDLLDVILSGENVAEWFQATGSDNMFNARAKLFIRQYEAKNDSGT